MIQKTLFGMAAVLAAAFFVGCNTTRQGNMNSIDFQRQALEDSLIAIRPGGIGGRPFWNTYANQFIHAPALEFPVVQGAVLYRYTVEDGTGISHVFLSESSQASFSPIWKELPTGPAFVTVEALDAQQNVLGSPAKRTFYRKAAFTGKYPPRVRSYADCARKAYEHLFNNKYILGLADGKPNLEYRLFCYPSKMHASIIEGMLNYAGMAPDRREAALTVAKGAAAYLMESAIPAGQPLEHLPITYDKNPFKMGGGDNTIMMLYPAGVGSAFLRLFRVTGDKTYLNYAMRIGDQYLRLQRPDGNWPLVLRIADGQPNAKNICIPTAIITFLEKLSSATGEAKYADAGAKAVPYLERMRTTFDWEGQFEDVEVSKNRYHNMTHACATGIYAYLAPAHANDPEFRRGAREVQRYAEDQFVVWEKPGWVGEYDGCKWRTSETLASRECGTYKWNTPCALEQYKCYVPVNSSAAAMIRYYLLMYDLEKDPIDLAKARALGDGITRIQNEEGRIPTWCSYSRPEKDDWINCSFATANALKKLAEYDSVP